MTDVSIPSLRHLHAFQTVASLESVSAASAAINLSQPAVTQVIANLDANFGATLFERRYNGSFLTEFGEILLVRSRRMFSIIEAALGILIPGTQNEAKSSLTNKITVTQIRSLIAVSENVSFDQAARSLGVSQPSLQRAARDLERLLRRPLYERGAQGTTTTKQGNEFARRIKLAVREIDHARDEINARKGVVTSLISVGTLPTSGSFLLSHAVNELLKQCPEARVRIIEESYEHLLDALRAGNIDFLFSVLRKPDWATDVSEKELFSDPYVIAVRPGHPLTRKREVKREDLMKYDWVLPGPSTPRYLAFKRLFTLSESAPTTHIVTTSRAILRSILTISDRMTLLTKHESEFEQVLGVLAVIPFTSKLPSRRYGVATRADWRPTALQRQFLNLLSAVSTETGGDPTSKRELTTVMSARG